MRSDAKGAFIRSVDHLFDVAERAIDPSNPSGWRAWFALSIFFAAVSGGIAFAEAIAGPYVVQDDARQHVFWMQTFLDPALFPHDRIAAYFRSVSPPGYVALFRLFAAAGVAPEQTARLLPAALSVSTAAFCFALVLRISKLPFAAFLSAWVLDQNLWLLDALSNATPRAFVYPLFLAFLYFVVRRAQVRTAIAVVLLGLFYPSMALVAAAVSILLLVDFDGARARITRARRNLGVSLSGFGAAASVLLPYVISKTAFHPVLTRAEAQRLPELGAGGRSSFFDPNPSTYWLCGERSGFLPLEWCWARALHFPGLPAPVLVVLLFAVLASPFLLRRVLGERAGHPAPNLDVWLRATAASFALFALAHVFLFSLHLPNRYTQHTLRMFFCVALATILSIAITLLFAWARDAGWGARAAAVLTAGALGGGMIIAPFASTRVAWHGYVRGTHPGLYRFLSSLPKDILIASLDAEADNIPTFSGRSVLAGREYAIPYHSGYYQEFRRRVKDLLRAQYSLDIRTLSSFIDTYHVDYWVVHRNAFTPGYIERDPWLSLFRPESDEASRVLAGGARPAVLRRLRACEAYEDEELIVLDGKCLGWFSARAVRPGRQEETGERCAPM